MVADSRMLGVKRWLPLRYTAGRTGLEPFSVALSSPYKLSGIVVACRLLNMLVCPRDGSAQAIVSGKLGRRVV